MPSFSSPLKTEAPRAARRERRNWNLRNAFSATLRRGPGGYGPMALVIVAGIVAAVVLWQGSKPAPVVPETIAFSEVATAISAGQVAHLRILDGGSRIVATLREPQVIDGRPMRVLEAVVPTRAVSMADLERWSATGAQVRVTEPRISRGTETAVQLLGVLAIVGLVTFLLLRHRGGVGNKRFVATPPSRQLTLTDVGGAREAQAELKDVIAYLKDPERFRAMGAKCPRGVLLVGPPGTGKTLLARAVAGEAGCPVIVAAGSDFNEMYVGVGSRRVRQLAKQAREAAPCIVFIDEFDSLGGRRGRPNRSGEEEVTLNQLLVEMDGMGGSEGIVWMAATNREDMLDPAVRRPGRFDRVVEVPLPSAADRLEILRIHSARAPLAPDVDLERLSRLTVGHSGAELANLLNEAAIVAVHDESQVITNAHIEQARDKIMLGRVRSGVVVSEHERQLIALHEAGHAVVGLVACPDDRLHKVTIEARGRSLGAAHFAPEADRHLYSRRYLEGILAKALGGRAAELIFLGHDAVTSGAGGDLVQATSVARRMVAEFGMSPDVGLINAEQMGNGGAPSGQLQSQIDDAVRKLIAVQSERAEQIVRQFSGAVQSIADALLQHNVLSAEEVFAIAREHGIEVREEAVA